MKSIKRLFYGFLLAVSFITFNELTFSNTFKAELYHPERYAFAEEFVFINELTDYDRLLINIQKCKNYLKNHEYVYDMSYLKKIPLHHNEYGTADCSSYVSWVLYESGYDQFKGDQWTSYDFGQLAQNPEYYEFDNWEFFLGEQSPENLMKGDILVYTGHVEFYAGSMDGSKPRVYSCGSNASMGSENLVTTASRTLSQLKAVIRVR